MTQGFDLFIFVVTGLCDANSKPHFHMRTNLLYITLDKRIKRILM